MKIGTWPFSLANTISALALALSVVGCAGSHSDPNQESAQRTEEALPIDCHYIAGSSCSGGGTIYYWDGSYWCVTRTTDTQTASMTVCKLWTCASECA